MELNIPTRLTVSRLAMVPILVLVLIYEPLGIHGRWLKIRQYFEEFPLYRTATHKRQRSYLRTERLR